MGDSSPTIPPERTRERERETVHRFERLIRFGVFTASYCNLEDAGGTYANTNETEQHNLLTVSNSFLLLLYSKALVTSSDALVSNSFLWTARRWDMMI